MAGGQAVIAVRETNMRFCGSGLKLRQGCRDSKRAQARAQKGPTLGVMGSSTGLLEVSFEDRELKKFLASLPHSLTPSETCFSGPNYDQQRRIGWQSLSDKSLGGKCPYQLSGPMTKKRLDTHPGTEKSFQKVKIKIGAGCDRENGQLSMPQF